MISRERLKISLKLFLIVIFSILSLSLFPQVFSRYQSDATVNTNIDVAFYVINASFQSKNIILEEIAPSDEPYLLNFSIANHNGSNRLEVDAIYELKIVTTTNLPLTYKLYKNEDYTDANATNLLEGTMELPAQDEDGTYFQLLNSSTEEFGFKEDQINEYQLLIYFPKMYMSHEYQDIVESIEITIDSKQKINENV